MKILVISFHYAPDLCAGSFRSTALVEQLVQHADEGVHIEVMTSLPHRYASYAAEAAQTESQPGLTIQRIALPQHHSGMLDQAWAFLYFAWAVRRLVRHQSYDVVYATSSRLMAAVLGAWVARQKKATLYLDIRDLFVKTIADVLSPRLAWILRPIFSGLEYWTFRQAKRINLVSSGFLPYISSRYPQAILRGFTNGIDEAFLVQEAPQPRVHDGLITILYAGNIGEGQGLHKIIPALAQRLRGRAQFQIIGDGGRCTALKNALREAACENVCLQAPMDRASLLHAYQHADVLFLHLNDYPAFRDVLPSKLFEYAAMGKPILAGVAGYCAQFIREELPGVAVFSPCSVEDALTVLNTLCLQTHDRRDFVQKYTRRRIMHDMAQDLISCRSA